MKQFQLGHLNPGLWGDNYEYPKGERHEKAQRPLRRQAFTDLFAASGHGLAHKAGGYA